MDLSEFRYHIEYRKGSDNLSADALSRLSHINGNSALYDVHDTLAHRGITRMWNYVKTHNLAYSLDEVKTMIRNCQVCCYTKPRFFKPSGLQDGVIKATQPFERLSIDLVGPKCPSWKTGNAFLLTIIDEYSRFPFAFSS